MVYDCLIIGAGPAGLSAAVQCGARGLSALVIGNPESDNPLWRSRRVDNYLGLPGRSGPELLEVFRRHAETTPAQFVTGRVLNAYAYGGAFSVTAGSEVYQGKSVILATGVIRTQPLPGEERLLGKGVSYCASCDGMLYRGRRVAVIGLAADAVTEAEMLARIGCQVTFVAPQRPEGLPEAIPYEKAVKPEILGEAQVTGVRTEAGELPCGGVFLLRDTVAPTALFPDLEVEQGYIKVDRAMATNLPGVFACGDCVGPPLQIAKAVGEGQVAAHSAGIWLKAQENG